MKSKLNLSTLALSLILVATAAVAEETGKRQVNLTIMSSEVNAFAPGVDAVVGLTEDQAKQLAAAYREVYETSAVALANMVLQDGNTTFAQRQMASATLQQTQAAFQARARLVFTEAQRQLIDKVQTTFTRVLQSVQKELNEKVTTVFGHELDTMLTAEQKAAMTKARAAIEDARRKAAAANQPTPPPTAPAGGH